MSVYIPNGGELILLDLAVKTTSGAENWTLHLFTNDLTVSASTVVGDMVEATFTGYSSQTLTRSTWGSSTTNGSGKAEITYGSVMTFTCTGGSSEDVYGYYVTRATTGDLVYLEKFSVYTTMGPSSTLNVTPKLTNSTE